MNQMIKFSLIAAAATVAFSGCGEQPRPTHISKPLVLPKAKKVVHSTTPHLNSNVSLVEFNVNKPLLFRPFDKATNQKKIYLSYIGLTTKQLDLKRNIVDSFRRLGYIVSSSSKTSDLFVAIYMTDNKTNSTKIDNNKIETKTYNFDIYLEQHIAGKTDMSEKYNRNTVSSGDLSTTDTNASASEASANTRMTLSKSELPYYIFKEEAKVKATFKSTNMQTNRAKENKIISQQLAYRLSKLLDF